MATVQDQTVRLDVEPQLRNLCMFLAVAEAKSIACAARDLFKAPSAITRSVIELERSIGVPLFERKSRGMLLNAYGEAVLVRARRIQDEIHAATEELLRAKTKTSRGSANAIRGLLFSSRKLQLLVHLEELRNISSTASMMDMTQSGASMALCRIEGILGLSLFHRRIEGMVATEAAERLVMRARRVFAELRHLASDISALAGQLTGTVVIGTTPPGRTDFLPTAIAATLDEHPGLRVTTVENLYDPLITSLRSGDIDMVFGVLRPSHLCHGLITEPLFMDRLSVVVRAGHPLASKTPLDITALLDERWILPRPNALARPLVDAAFAKLGHNPPIPSVETGDLSIVRQLLLASDMLAVTSPNQLTFELRSGSLVELPVALGGKLREIALIVREGAMLSPAAHAVLDAVHHQIH